MAVETPYAPPKARVAAEIRLPPSTPLAALGRRVVHLLLDWVFAWLFSILCGFLVGVAIGLLDIEGVNLSRLAGIVALAGFILYYVVFEASFGWTLAKLITGSRVVDQTGGKPSLLKVLGRTLARGVPFEPFSFLGRTGIGWHDRWSGTRVVTTRAVDGPAFADSFRPGFRRGRAPERVEPG
ncbi:MAG TPA: RDD family protein [Burkholderiales bacterium]